jgi:Ni,Fe-hydrogenase I small subunit
MTINAEIGSLFSDEESTAFAAQAEAITSAMEDVAERHPAYSWVWTDEIRCRGCSASLEIPLLASTAANADKAFQAHVSAELDTLLNEGPAVHTV